MRVWSSLFPLTLRQWLGIVYLLGIALLAVVIAGWLRDHLNIHFRDELLNHGRTLAERLAEDSRIALIQRAPDNVRIRADMTRDFPNVAGVAILTRQGELLVATGTLPFSWAALPPIDESWEGARLILEDDHYLVLVAPVRVAADPARPDPFTLADPAPPIAAPDPPAPTEWLGTAVLTMSKSAMEVAVRATYHQMLVVIAGGATVVGLGLLAVLGWITRPLQRLADLMADPETPQRYTQAPMRGVREARAMASAFNALIAAFARVNQELVNTNFALERSRHNLTSRVRKATGDLMTTLEQMERQKTELMHAREHALTASRVKSEFLANMSHEIRTPMHGVLGFITVLARTELNPIQTSYLRLLQHAADNLMTIIDGILDFSKLEAGKIQLRLAPFKLHHVLETTGQLFTPNAQAKGLVLEWAIDPQLPEVVLGDRQRLTQVLHNLVDNAIKFTDRGSVQVQACLAQREEAFILCHLKVQDTGIGIPSAYQATIFTAFNQVDASTTRQQGGTGLGLAICQQLVGLMGGCLTVHSQEGRGSSFQFDVRLQIAPAEDRVDAGRLNPESLNDEDERYRPPVRPRQVTPLPTVGAPQNRHRLRPTRVLVVDDNPTNRALADIVLADLHTDRDLVSNGAAALTACCQQRYDLILMDLRMPGIDGLETTRRIRQLCNNPNCTVPIIGLTADLLGVDHEGWREAGLTDCLYKPLKVEVLSQVLAQWGMGSSPDPCSIPRFF